MRGAKADSMPPQYRARLNDPSRPEQARPKPAHPCQQRPVAPTQTMRCPPERDIKLVTKKEILDFQLPPRFEPVGDEHHEQVDVFYVTDLFGAKITSATRQAAIKRALISLFAAHERPGKSAKRPAAAATG